MNPDEAFSLEDALRRVEGDRQLLARLGEMLRQEWPSTLVGLQQAVTQRDGAELARRAHQLAGSLGLFAPGPAMQLARQLEAQAKAGDWAPVPETLTLLERASLQVQDLIQQACLGV